MPPHFQDQDLLVRVMRKADAMIQNESRLEVADNSGARVVMVIGVYGGSTAARSTRKTAGVGDRIKARSKSAFPTPTSRRGTW